MNSIPLNVFVYKAYQYYSGTQYIHWLVNHLLYIQSCIVKESFPVCALIGLTWIVEASGKAYTNNAIPDKEKLQVFESTS